MLRRRFIRLAVAAPCLAVVPAAAPVSPRAARITMPPLIEGDKKLTPEKFAEYARTDPVRMLSASLSHYQDKVKGYSCTLEKQERVKGTLLDKEVIDIAFRDDPFAVHMKWQDEKRAVTAALYASGENNGKMLARTPAGIIETDPLGFFARQNSRYTILDFGIGSGTLRTYNTWKKAADEKNLNFEYVYPKPVPVPECGDRLCHVLRRTCEPPEVANFSMAEPEVKSPAKFPKETIKTITVMFDAETFLQVGTKLDRPDGTLLAYYYFRNLQLNPSFKRGQFLPSSL